jgi:hypothetical protein
VRTFFRKDPSSATETGTGTESIILDNLLSTLKQHEDPWDGYNSREKEIPEDRRSSSPQPETRDYYSFPLMEHNVLCFHDLGRFVRRASRIAHALTCSANANTGTLYFLVERGGGDEGMNGELGSGNNLPQLKQFRILNSGGILEEGGSHTRLVFSLLLSPSLEPIFWSGILFRATLLRGIEHPTPFLLHSRLASRTPPASLASLPSLASLAPLVSLASVASIASIASSGSSHCRWLVLCY